VFLTEHVAATLLPLLRIDPIGAANPLSGFRIDLAVEKEKHLQPFRAFQVFDSD